MPGCHHLKLAMILGLPLLCCPAVRCQVPSLLPIKPSPQPATPEAPADRTKKAPVLPGGSDEAAAALPDAPAPAQDVVVAARKAFQETGDPSPVSQGSVTPVWEEERSPNLYERIKLKRTLLLSNQRFLNQEVALPMTSSQKAFMAATDVADLGNLFVIAVSSGIYIASAPRNAYGPGLKGFGLNYGYALAQDGTGELFGTFLIPTLAHQDPRYHRLPGAPVQKRIFHALAHTLVSQHDNGTPMPNYATLLTYPIAAVSANSYVPGLQRDLPSTVRRIAIGLASDPADALIGEFLPDVARRIHIRVTFFQQVINDLSTEHPM